MLDAIIYRDTCRIISLKRITWSVENQMRRSSDFFENEILIPMPRASVSYSCGYLQAAICIIKTIVVDYTIGRKDSLHCDVHCNFCAYGFPFS
jgi:hypothetical protein